MSTVYLQISHHFGSDHLWQANDAWLRIALVYIGVDALGDLDATGTAHDSLILSQTATSGALTLP